MMLSDSTHSPVHIDNNKNIKINYKKTDLAGQISCNTSTAPPFMAEGGQRKTHESRTTPVRFLNKNNSFQDNI